MIWSPVVRVSLLLSAIAVVGLVLAGVSLHRIVSQLRVDRNLVTQRVELSQQFEQLLGDLHGTERARATLEVLRPERKNLVRFVRGLEAAAAAAFIDQKIEAIPPESDALGQSYALPVVRYRVTLQGTLEKIEAFLQLLDGLPELVRVEGLEVKTTPDGHLVVNGTAELLLAVAVRETP